MMFAVPGWSLSADSPKIQTAVVTTGPQSTTHHPQSKVNDEGRGTEKKKTTKKRKRAHARNDVAVTQDNLGGLWARYLEGKDVGEGGQQQRSDDIGGEAQRKKNRRDDAQQVTGVDGGNIRNGPSRIGERENLVNPIPTEGETEGNKLLRADEISTKDPTMTANRDVPQEPDDGRAKYERRKAKAERKREQRAQKQANGELPPPRPEADAEIAASKAQNKRAKKTAKHAGQNETTMEPNGLDLAQANSGPTKHPLSSSTTTIIPTNTSPLPPKPAITTTVTKLTPLQTKMAAKLTSARFRHLNETLYTTPSSASLSLFTTNPSAYTAYHAGFRAQVAIWPSNPIDDFIEDVKARGALGKSRDSNSKGSQAKAFRTIKRNRQGGGGGGGAAAVAEEGSSTTPPPPSPLPRTNGTSTIADFGCGDARLAGSLHTSKHLNLNLKLLSFDLAQGDGPWRDLVTVADTTDLKGVGVTDGSVDVVVCCLSLMGTDWVRVVDECARVVRWGGEVWVAEIRSRFGRRKEGEGVVGKKKTMTTTTTTKKKRKKRGREEGKGEEEEEDDLDATFTLEEDTLGPSSSSSKPNTISQETDLSPFLSVWKKRSFELAGTPDVTNKMFVKMRFVKEKEMGGARGGDGGGGRFMTSRARMVVGKSGGGAGGSKFIERDGDVEEVEGGEIDEGRVLKPCVYKTR